ncbi:mechanosensitive ion channel domain-containing protein [Roseateles chitinivorans]|uniref:mechanosensitive ion channel domain-containing protein n=1 Tax=Roseateles chitinivorans TaxID=2917965 RepID=UPI003D66DA79
MTVFPTSPSSLPSRRASPPLRRWLLCALMLCAAALAMPAFAQDPAPEPTDPAKLLDLAKAELKAAQPKPGKELTNEDLSDIKNKVERVKSRIDQARSALQPKLDDAKNRLTQLGATQADVKETPEVAQLRAQLGREVATIDGQMKVANDLGGQADSTLRNANAAQRLQLSARLGERVPSLLQSGFWRALGSDRAADVERARVFGIEFGALWSSVPATAWATFVAAVAAWLLLCLGARRLTARLCATRIPPGRLRRSLFAVSEVILRTLRPGLIAHGLVLTLTASLVDGAPQGPDSLAQWLDTAEMIVWFGGFIAGLGAALLMARKPSWRLLPVPDVAASRLAWLPRTLAAAVVLGWLSSRTAATLDLSASSSSAVQTLASLTFVAVLGFAIAQLRRHAVGATQDGADLADAGTGKSPELTIRPLWLSVLRAVAWLTLVGATLSLLIGFVSLAMFVLNQIVWALIVIGGAYLLTVLVDDLFMTLLAPSPAAPSGDGKGSAGAKPGASASPTASADDGPAPPRTREQTALLLSAVCRLSIVFFALLLLLAPYGEGPMDLVRRSGSLQDGITVGTLQLNPIKLLQALTVLFVGLGAVRLLKGWLTDSYMPTTRMDVGMRSSTTTLFGYIGTVVAIAAALRASGFSMQSVAWVASALSVGIGFGLQSIVQNFVSGLILLAERPVKVGDWVSLSGVEGDIRRISVRATEIQMGDRSTVIVPNSEFITKIVRNVTYGESLGMVQFKLPMPLATDTDRVKALVLEAFQAHGGVLATPAPNVQLDGVDGTNLILNASGFVNSPRAAYGIKSELLFAVLSRLRAEGLLPGQTSPPAPV